MGVSGEAGIVHLPKYSTDADGDLHTVIPGEVAKPNIGNNRKAGIKPGRQCTESLGLIPQGGDAR